MGILQLKRGNTKPSLKEGEPFYNTEEKNLIIGDGSGEDIILDSSLIASLGFGSEAYGKISVVVIDATTLKPKVYLIEPNQSVNVPTANFHDRVLVFVNNGVLLSGTSEINLSTSVEWAKVFYAPFVRFDDAQWSSVNVNANVVYKEGAPLWEMDATHQKIEGAEIEILGVVYLDDSGGEEGATMGVKYKNVIKNTDEQFFMLEVDNGAIKLNAVKLENNFLSALGDAKIYPRAWAVKTPDYDNAHIFGVDVELRTFEEYQSENTLVIFRPFGVQSAGENQYASKIYYPDLNSPAAIQFSVKIAGIGWDSWADEYFEL